MDPVDRADQEIEEHLSDLVGLVQRNAAKIPAGQAGICEICDEPKERVVERDYRGHAAQVCARCRDDFKLG